MKKSIEEQLAQAVNEILGEEPTKEHAEELLQCFLGGISGIMYVLGINKTTMPIENMMVVTQVMPIEFYEEIEKNAERVMQQSPHLFTKNSKQTTH